MRLHQGQRHWSKLVSPTCWRFKFGASKALLSLSMVKKSYAFSKCPARRDVLEFACGLRGTESRSFRDFESRTKAGCHCGKDRRVSGRSRSALGQMQDQKTSRVLRLRCLLSRPIYVRELVLAAEDSTLGIRQLLLSEGRVKCASASILSTKDRLRQQSKGFNKQPQRTGISLLEFPLQASLH